MRPAEHAVPAATFTELSEGAGGARAVRRLADGQYSRYLILIRGVRDAAVSSGHPDAARTRHAYESLMELQESDPGAVQKVLRHPPVAAWARRAILGTTSGAEPLPADAPGRLAGLAAAAAVRAGVPCETEVPIVDGAVVLPSLGRAAGLPGSGHARVISTGAGTEVTAGTSTARIPGDPHTGAPGWEPLRPVDCEAQGRGFHVLIEDVDPHRMPGASNLAGRLSDAQVTLWRASLAEAWELLIRHHRDVADEVAAGVRVLTPLLAPEHGQTSATSRETFGCVAMSDPPDPCAVAVTLAHEVQHAKLSALLDLLPLLQADTGARFYAPWRDDPRPLSGLLQGAYAHLGVAAFWRRQRHHETPRSAALYAEAEYAHWREATSQAVQTIADSGLLTVEGRTFMAGMRRALERWDADVVDPDAVARAARAADEHLARWRERNGAHAGR